MNYLIKGLYKLANPKGLNLKDYLGFLNTWEYILFLGLKALLNLNFSLNLRFINKVTFVDLGLTGIKPCRVLTIFNKIIKYC